MAFVLLTVLAHEFMNQEHTVQPYFDSITIGSYEHVILLNQKQHSQYTGCPISEQMRKSNA